MENGKGKPGTLYMCATPIGNLEDITLRVIRVLKEVDYIAAEDTRHTLKLLNHFNISKPLISYHQHSKEDREEKIISLLEDGNSIALVSDAGMPGISDPGEDLVKLAHKRGVPVTVLPGPSAGLSALVLSGLPAGRFVFEGFIPREGKERKTRLGALRNEERTIILYEAPHRLLATLGDLYETLGDRRIAVVRELTKVHEEILVLKLGEAVAHFEQHPCRGEFVLVVEGAEINTVDNSFEDISIEEHIKKYMEAGLTKKEAIKQVAKDRKVPKNQVYKYSINL